MTSYMIYFRKPSYISGRLSGQPSGQKTVRKAGRKAGVVSRWDERTPD
jgi:hypothetical protein